MYGDPLRNEAVGGVDVRGSATGSVRARNAESRAMWRRMFMRSCFRAAAPSGWKPRAASGGRSRRRGIGFDTGVTHVPIVPGAILFDLAIGNAHARPDREMGEKAVAAANDGPVAEGNVGAGTGATVGKMFGMKQAMKSGIGSASLTLGSGVMVARWSP